MKKARSIRRSRDELIFDIVNVFLLVLFSLACLLPMLNVFSKAFSSESMVISGRILFWPREFQVESVWFMLNQVGFRTSFINTVYITVVGTLLNLIITVLAAYPLSRKRLKGRSYFLFVIVFTMLFSGGLIPTFILVQRLGLMNNLWALILPGLTSPFFIIVLRNYFEGIPVSLEESAKIDGASNARTLISVMLPLALPCLATLAVFYAVAHWNNYFGPLLYIHSRENFTLQLYLRQILDSTSSITASTLINATQMRALRNKAPLIIQASAVFLTTVPILVVYPFLQRYFVRGMTLGAVKG